MTSMASKLQKQPTTRFVLYLKGDLLIKQGVKYKYKIGAALPKSHKKLN